MKIKTKSRFFILSATAIFLLLFATNLQAQVRFGAIGGLNINSVTADFDNDLDVKSKLGYHAGIIGEYYFAGITGIQTGLIFNTKGYQIDVEETYDDGDGYQKYRLSYLEIPLNLIVDVSVLQLHIGPYFALGVDGAYSYDYSYLQIGNVEFTAEGDDDVEFEAEVDDDDYNTGDPYVFPYDIGVNIGAGFQAGPLMLRAQYSMGFVNMVPELKDNSSFREDNRMTMSTISFSVGILIGDED